MLFSKALFKQSCKANKVMWTIITFAVCFMLACVMLISGGGKISKVKNGIEDTIIESEIDTGVKKTATNYYLGEIKALTAYDNAYKNIEATGNQDEMQATIKAIVKGDKTDAETIAKADQVAELAKAYTVAYKTAIEAGKTEAEAQQLAVNAVSTAVFSQTYAGLIALGVEEAQAQQQSQATAQQSVKGLITVFVGYSYNAGCVALKTVYDEDKVQEFSQIFAVSLKLGLGGDTESALYQKISANDTSFEDSYKSALLSVDERKEYVHKRISQLIAVNLTEETYIENMISNLSGYDVDRKKYEGFVYVNDAGESVSRYVGNSGYIYIQDLSEDVLVTLIARIEKDVAIGKDEATVSGEIAQELTASFLSALSSDVSLALKEVGEMDLYGVVVGCIFYKMAGLLLPIIYMIMCANNLIAGQVDSGSMAYVLSTSTKRKQVTFTQAVFLIGSLFAMFVCTTITSEICLAIVMKDSIRLTYGKVALLNLGAFLTMFGMSGISFLASCWFNRSKYSMSLGGGLNMFFLVATMLGLFGSQVIPSIIRLSALNYFNYFSLISLFDSISILSGTLTFIWKWAILVAIGVVCYFIGFKKFEKKDLPL